MSHTCDSATTLKVFLFTDLVGSTELKRRLGDAAGAAALGAHDRLFRRCLAAHGGHEHDHAGDGFFAVFDLPSAALSCALEFLDELGRLETAERLRVRCGIHLGESVQVAQTTGAAASTDPAGATAGSVRMVGLAVDTAARVMGLAQGGQILLTRGAFDSARQQVLAGPGGAALQWRAHGPYLFAGLEDPLEIFEVGVEGAAPLAPPPDSEKAKRAAAPGEEATLGWRPAAGRAVPGREHWKLVDPVGEGGFGEVWVAAHDKTGEQRIFKFCFDAERVRGLRREVVLFRLLKESLGERDDIARILDWQLDRAPFFLEAEYTAAGDLARWARERGGLAAVPLATRLEIVAQIAVALGAAHSVGVLHKDVKPANVLITEGGDAASPRASLTDFGIGLVTSREALEGGAVTVAGFTRTLLASSASSHGGTHLYMAPELIEGKPPTTLADIYSLGVVLYQMVIGDLARALAPGWDRDVTDELLREDIAAATDGDLARRSSSAGELASRLRGLQQRRAAQAERERTRREAETSRRRRRQLALMAAAGVSVALAVAFVAWREVGLRRLGEERQYVMSVQLAASHLAQGNRSLAREVLLRAPERLRGWEWGHLVGEAWPETRREPRTIAAGETAAAMWRDADAIVVATLPGQAPVNVRFGANGSRLVASDGTEVKVWEVATAQARLVSSVQSDSSYALLSHDGNRVVALREDGTIALHDTNNGRVLSTLSGHEVVSNSGWFSPDDSLLVTTSPDRTLRVWEAATGRPLLALSEAGRDLPVLDAVFLDGGSRLLVPSSDQSLVTYELASGREEARIQGPVVPGFEPVYVSPDGRHVVSIDRLDGSGLIYAHPQRLLSSPFVWSSESGERLYDLPLLRDRSFTGAGFTPDGTVLACYYRDGAVQLIDAEAGEQLTVLTNHFDTVLSVSWNLDGSRLAVGGLDGTIRLLAPAAGEETPRDRLAGHGDLVLNAAWSPDGARLASVSYDGTVGVWEVATRERIAVLRHGEPVLGASWSADGALLSTTTSTRNQLWEIASFESRWSVARPERLGSDVRSTAYRFIAANTPLEGRFSPDSSRHFPSGENRVFDTRSGRVVVTLEGDGSLLVGQSAIGPDGARILARPQGGPAHVWDAGSGRRLYTLDGRVFSATFSPDGSRIGAGFYEGTVRIFDAATGGEVLTIQAHRAPAKVRFDGTGKRIVSCSWDQTARVWDTDTGGALATLAGHKEVLLDAFFSPDGSRVLTLALDLTARVWDLAGRELLKISPDATVHQVRWSPDGSTIAMPLADGTVRLYDSIPWRELAAGADDAMPFEERVQRWRQARDATAELRGHQ